MTTLENGVWYLEGREILTMLVTTYDRVFDVHDWANGIAVAEVTKITGAELYGILRSSTTDCVYMTMTAPIHMAIQFEYLDAIYTTYYTIEWPEIHNFIHTYLGQRSKESLWVEEGF